MKGFCIWLWPWPWLHVSVCLQYSGIHQQRSNCTSICNHCYFYALFQVSFLSALLSFFTQICLEQSKELHLLVEVCLEKYLFIQRQQANQRKVYSYMYIYLAGNETEILHEAICKILYTTCRYTQSILNNLQLLYIMGQFFLVWSVHSLHVHNKVLRK